jgi:hypothetical protein
MTLGKGHALAVHHHVGHGGASHLSKAASMKREPQEPVEKGRFPHLDTVLGGIPLPDGLQLQLFLHEAEPLQGFQDLILEVRRFPAPPVPPAL